MGAQQRLVSVGSQMMGASDHADYPATKTDAPQKKNSKTDGTGHGHQALV
jgi:hypothetical protein